MPFNSKAVIRRRCLSNCVKKKSALNEQNVLLSSSKFVKIKSSELKNRGRNEKPVQFAGFLNSVPSNLYICLERGFFFYSVHKSYGIFFLIFCFFLDILAWNCKKKVPSKLWSVRRQQKTEFAKIAYDTLTLLCEYTLPLNGKLTIERHVWLMCKLGWKFVSKLWFWSQRMRRKFNFALWLLISP